jgi:hypothetical protein
VIAGELWDIISPKGAFLAGAIFAAVSVAALLWVRRAGEFITRAKRLVMGHGAFAISGGNKSTYIVTWAVLTKQNQF